jgi:hypothetical protein
MFHPFLTLSPQARSFGGRMMWTPTFPTFSHTNRAPLFNAVRAAQWVQSDLSEWGSFSL